MHERMGGFGIATIVLLLGVVERVDAQPTLLEGHTEPVYAAAYTADGRWLVTAGFDETVRLWDTRTGELARTMTGHQGLVLAVAVSRDGSRIASGGLDRTIKLWDVPTTEPTGTIAEQEGEVNAVATSADGKWLATGGADKVLRLRSTEDANLVRDVAGNESAITRVGFRPDLQQIATGNEAGVVRIFAPADGSTVGVIGAHAGPVTGLAWAPNNSFLLTAGTDGLVRRWPNTFSAGRTITGHTGDVLRVRISPNGQRLVSASADKTVRLWNFGDGKDLKSLDGHDGTVRSIAFTSSSARFATGGEDGIARLFDANSGELVRAFPALPESVTAVAVHPNNQEIAVGDAKGAIKVFGTADGSELRTLAGHTGAINGLAWTPNGSHLVSASADESIHVWNANDGSEQRMIDVGTPVTCLDVSTDSTRLIVGGEDKVVRTYQVGDGAPLLVLEGHLGAITDVEFGRDNQRIVACSDDGVATIWDRATNLPLQHFPLPKGAATASFGSDGKTIAYGGQSNDIRIDTLATVFAVRADAMAVNDLAVNSNSSTFVTANEDGTVKLWNTGNGGLVREFAGPTAAVTCVALSPNGGQVVAGAKDETVYVWNGNGPVQYEVQLPSEVARVAFSPDGRKLVAVGADRSIRAYDPTPPNPQPVQPLPLEVSQTLTGHEQPIKDIAFAPDNRTLLTASEDGTARTWSIAAVGTTANLTGHGDAVYGLVFDATGGRLFSTSNDKTARVWDLERKQAIATLSNTANGTLYGIDVSADGEQLVVAGADGSVRLFDTTKHDEIRRFTGPEYALYDAVLSPDGKTVAAGGMGLGTERPVLLWNVEDESPATRLVGHGDDCYAVDFNANGSRLLSVGYSGAVKVWDVAAGKVVFESDLGQVAYSGTWSPDGTRIAVCAGDGKVHFVEVPEGAR